MPIILSSFVLTINNKNYLLNTNLLGDFNVYNLACALLCCHALGFSYGRVKENIEDLKVSGRLELLNTNTPYIFSKEERKVIIMKIAIGADHGGYKLKEEIKKYLDELEIKYGLTYKFEKGLNRICAITIALDNNDIEVTRTKVLVSTDMFKSEYAAISTAIGIGEGKVYLAPIDEFSIKYRMSEYGFMTVNSGESGTKRINRIGSIVPGDTELIDIVDTECNTFAVSLVVQKDNLYTFVKYYTYGRTN